MLHSKSEHDEYAQAGRPSHGRRGGRSVADAEWDSPQFCEQTGSAVDHSWQLECANRALISLILTGTSRRRSTSKAVDPLRRWPGHLTIICSDSCRAARARASSGGRRGRPRVCRAGLELSRARAPAGRRVHPGRGSLTRGRCDPRVVDARGQKASRVDVLTALRSE